MSHYSIQTQNGKKIVPRQTDVARNEKIRAMYNELNVYGQRIYSIRKLAAIFHRAPSRIHKIIHAEESRV